MANPTRGGSKGNGPVDYTALRKDLTKGNPALDFTLGLAVARNASGPESDELQKHKVINHDKLRRLSDVTSNNIHAAAELRAITPYIGKAELIWQTLLCHPNGKQDRILSRDTQNSSIKNAALHAELLKVWDEYYTNDYKIEKDLKKIISDILFNTGSYPLMTLSNPDLDYLINGSEIAGIAGNENFVQLARQGIRKEFIEDPATKTLRMRNHGRFIRNPDKSEDRTAWSGLESILSGGSGSSAEMEFNLLGKEDDSNVCGITITDNLNALYLQRIEKVIRNEDIAKVTGVENLGLVIQAAMTEKPTAPAGTATYTDANGKKHEAKVAPNPIAKTKNLTEQQLEEVTRKTFPFRNVQPQSVQFVKPMDALSRKPFGRGITFKLPSEAVVPVGNDFIVLLDPKTGGFLNTASEFEFYQTNPKSQTQQRPNAGSTNQLISNLKRIQEGKACDFDMHEFTEMTKAKLMERFIACSVSGRGANISVELSDEVVKIFLSRMFRGQGVRCLYVPGEAMTYMALNYNGMGVGQSLTQQAKSHILRLAALDLADTLANLEAATPHTEMIVRLDPKSPEPFADVAMAQEAFFTSNPHNASLLTSSIISVPQIAESIRRNSLTVKVEANENPFYPKTDIVTQQKEKGNFKAIDSASREELLNKISNYLHLSRSWLDIANDQNNFQIEAIAQQELLLNQIVNWQEMLGDQLGDFERKHAMKNIPFVQDLVEVVKENRKLWTPDSKEELPGDDNAKVNAILFDFINNLIVSFPAPASIDNASKLKDNLTAVNELIKAWVDMACIGDNMTQIAKLLGLSTEEGDDDTKVSELYIKEQVTSVLMVEAFRRYNLPMPFDSIVNAGEGGGMASIVNDVIAQRRNLALFLSEMAIGVNEADVKILKTYAKKIDNSLAKLRKAKEAIAAPLGEDENNALSNDDEFGATPDPEDAGLDDDGAPGGDDPITDPDTDSPEEEEEEDPDSQSNNDGTDPSKNDPDHQPFQS